MRDGALLIEFESHRRFRTRGIRIDSDLNDPAMHLDGFICPRSFSRGTGNNGPASLIETGQGAFTWTGPYGSGKSSLVVALSAVLNGNSELRHSHCNAESILGRKTASRPFGRRCPHARSGWRILPVVGRRDRSCTGHRRSNCRDPDFVARPSARLNPGPTNVCRMINSMKSLHCKSGR